MTQRLLTGLSIAIVFVLVTGTVQSQVLTLDDCIEMALKNRESIIRARGAENLAKWNHRWAIGQFLPNVSAQYSYNKGKQTEIDPPNIDPFTGDTLTEQDTGPNKSLSFSGGISIFNISNWFNLFGSAASKGAARLDVINSEQDLILSVKTAYYAYLATIENVDVQHEAVKRSGEQLKLIESKFELGSASRSDVLKQKVQVGNDRLTSLTADNTVATSKATLAFTIGLDPNGDQQFSTEYVLREYEGTVSDAMAFGLGHEPGLLSGYKRVTASKHALRSRWSGYLPTVDVWASYRVFEGTQAFPVVFDYSFNSSTVGFNVNLNIFDGFSRERELNRARINLNNSRAALADTKNRLSRDIKTAYLDIQQFKEAKVVAGESVEAATEDLRITQEKYNLGAATILDLLDAQVSLKKTQLSLITADFNLNLAVAKLENSMGKM